MRGFVAAVVTLVLIGIAPPLVARADTPIEVDLRTCPLLPAATVHVPAAAPIVFVGIAWVAQTRGLVMDFQHGEETTLYRNNVVVPAASDPALWSAPRPYVWDYSRPIDDPYLRYVDLVPGHEWATDWRYTTTAPAAGTTVRYRLEVHATRRMIDLIGFSAHAPWALVEGEWMNFGRCAVVGD